MCVDYPQTLLQPHNDSDSGSESDHTYELPPSESLPEEEVPVSVDTCRIAGNFHLR